MSVNYSIAAKSVSLEKGKTNKAMGIDYIYIVVTVINCFSDEKPSLTNCGFDVRLLAFGNYKVFH